MQKPETKSSKVLIYDYFFNYSGEEIAGACVRIAVHAYAKGQEVKFIAEPVACRHFLSEIYQVSFDEKNGISIEENLRIDNLFRLICDWDKIDYTIDSFLLENKELEKQLCDECQNTSCSETIELSKEEFETFLKAHANKFDKKAQALSVRFC